MNTYKIYLALVAILISISLSGQTQLNRKQSGTATMNTGDTEITVTLPLSVDINSTFLSYSVRVNSDRPGEFLIGGRLSGTNQLTFTRDETGPVVTINWQVLEFETGISVYHGSGTIVNGASFGIEDNAGAPVTVSEGSSWAVVNYYNNGGTFGNDDAAIIKLANNAAGAGLYDQVTFQMAAGDVEGFWQVIECTDCNVQEVSNVSFDTDNNNDDSNLIATSSITAVDLNKTLLFSSHSQGGNVEGDDLVSSRLTNSTTVTFERADDEVAIPEVYSFVVEFTDATTIVQQVDASFTNNSSTTISIGGVNELASLVSNGSQFGYQGHGGITGADNPGANWFTFDFSSSSTLRIERAESSASATVPVQVAEFDLKPTQTWYAFINGNWSNPGSWTLDASTAPLYDNPSTEIPGPGDLVVIYAGKTITVDVDNIDIDYMEVRGNLNLGNSTGHSFSSINGDGFISLSGHDPGSGLEFNFPSGSTDASIGFGDVSNGGTLIVNGAGDIVLGSDFTSATNRPFKNIRIDRTNATDKLIVDADVLLNGDLDIRNGDFQLNSTTTGANAPNFIEVLEDVTVSSTGSMSVANNDVFDNLSGGTYGDYHRSYSTLQVGGNFTNQGTVRLTNQTVPDFNDRSTTGAASLVFNRSVNSTLSCNGTTDLYNLVVDKGTDQSYQLTVFSDQRSNFALYGPVDGGANTGGGNAAHPEVQKSLYVANGTLRLTGQVFIPTVSEGGRDFEIGERAAIVLDGPDVVFINTASEDDISTYEDPATWGLSYSGAVTGVDADARLANLGVISDNGQQAFTIYGKLQVDDGLFYLGDGLSILFRDFAPGTIEINGGELNTNQLALSNTAATGEYTVIINGGILRATGDYPTRDDDALINLPEPAVVFTMTGGEIIVEGRTGWATTNGINIQASAATTKVTGGTLRFDNTENIEVFSTVPFYNVVIAQNDVTLQNNFRVLNDLTLETGSTRTDANGTYGSRLITVTATDGSATYDLEIGGDFTMNDNTVLDIWSGAANNANSSRVTFNGNESSVFYVGDITTYDNALTGFDDPEGDPTFRRWELPLYDLVINKPGDTLSLSSKDPGRSGNPNGGNLSTFKTGTGGKNVQIWASNLIKVLNSFSLTENSTFDQIDPNDATVGYSVRLYGSDISNSGRFFTYTDGVTSKDGLIKLRTSGGDFTVTTTSAATFGNLRLNSGTDIVTITSDVAIQRLEYRHGRLNIGTHNLKIDIMDLNLAGGEVQQDDGQELFTEEDMIIMAGNASDGGLSLKVPRVVDLTYGQYDNDNDEYNNANWLWFPIGTDANSTSRYTPAVCYLHNSGTITGDEYITVTLVDRELATAGAGTDKLSYYWSVDYEGWDKGSAAAANRPTVSWLFQYDDGDVTGTEGQYVPGKVEDGTDEDGDASGYSRSTEGNGNSVRDGGDAGNNGSIVGDSPRNIIVFVNDGNVNIQNNNNAVFNGSSITATWNEFPGVGLSLSNSNYTAGDQNAFSGQPTVYRTREDRTNTTRGWRQNNTWERDTNGDGNFNNNNAYPEAGDIAIIRLGTEIEISNTAEAAAEVLIDASRSGSAWNDTPDGNTYNGRSKLVFVDPDGAGYNSVFGRIRAAASGTNQSRGTLEFYLDGTWAGNFIEADFGDFVNFTNADGTYFEWTYNYFDEGTVTDAAGPIELPTPTNIYPQLRFQIGTGTDPFNGNAATAAGPKVFEFANANITVLDQMRLQDGIIVRLSDGGGNLTVNGRVQFDNDNENARIQFPGNTVTPTDFTVKGNIEFNNVGGGAVSKVIEVYPTGSAVTHTLNIEGDIDFQEGGTLDLNSGTSSNVDLIFSGATGPNRLYASSGTPTNRPDLYKIAMNKGTDVSQTFTIETDFDLADASAAFQPVEILNGTLVLNADGNPGTGILIANGSNLLLPNLNNSQASSGSGALEITQGIVRVEGDDTGIVLDGILRINGGELNMISGTGNGNNFIEYSTTGNSTIEISSGNLFVGSQVRRPLTTTSGILNYDQTGGDALFGFSSAPEATRGVFEVLNTESSFTYTGGTFSIVSDNGSATVPSLRLSPASSNIGASQVIYMGTQDTPAGQDDMGIYSDVAIGNLEVGNVQNTATNPTVKIYSLPLTINALTINSNGNGPATFSANGNNLTLTGDIINNGIFTTNGSTFNNQTTFFNTSGTSTISGTGTTDFYNLDKTGSGTLALTNDVTVESDAFFRAGTVNTNSAALVLEGDLLHDAVHASTLEPDAQLERGIVFKGNEKQLLSRSGAGSSTFGMLRVDNIAGVEIQGSGENFIVDQKLTLVKGPLDIGGNLLTLAQDAVIENGVNGETRSDFNVNNMIQTNSSITDFGVRKIYSSTTGPTTFTYPVGLTAYTPVVLNLGAMLDGNITVRPVSDTPPTAEDSEAGDAGCSDPEITDAANVLQYYWIVRSNGVSNLQGDFEMYYDDSDLAFNATHYSEANYGAARLYDSQTSWDKNAEVTSVVESTNRVNFNFSGNSDAQLEGIYSAGVIQDGAGVFLCGGGAIPDEVPQYLTVGSGTNTYSTDASYQATATNPSGGAPPASTAVDITVSSGFTLQLDQSGIRARKLTIEAGGILEVQSGVNNLNLGLISGEGTLKLVTNGADAPAFPTADYDNFFPGSDCVGGGGLEYAGDGSYDVLAGIPIIRNITFSGSGIRTLPNNGALLVCEDLTMGGSVSVVVPDGNNNTTVEGNILKADLASFDNGGGSSRIILKGSSQQRISGDFTGTNTFNQLQIDNSTGATVVNSAQTGIAADGDVEIENDLILTAGQLTTSSTNTLRILSSGTVSTFSATSFVNGPLLRELQDANGIYSFPVGNTNRFGLLEIIDPNVSSTRDFEVQYYDANPRDDANITTGAISTAASTFGIDRISGNEYWRVDVESTGSPSSQVRLHWDGTSEVNSTISNLHVMFIDPLNTAAGWDRLARTTAPTGSATSGYLDGGPLSYSTKYVTFGTLNSTETPLPVTLIHFKGRADEKSIVLDWATASEINNDYFEVHHSQDGDNFELIGTVQGAGNSTEMLEYEFVDRSPFVGNNFYRFKQVDFDGQFEYSPIILVSYEGGDDYSIELYPNPVVEDFISININGGTRELNGQYIIHDMHGRVVQMGEVRSRELQLPVYDFESGLYFLRLHLGSKYYNVKFIKQ